MMKYISNAIAQLKDGKRWKEMKKEMDGSKSIGKFIQPSAQCSTSLLETSPLANSVSHHELNIVLT